MFSLSRKFGWLALASLATFVSFGPNALGDPPVDQVNVVNPATSPVPTTVLNPATMPALTSSVDDPGRSAYATSVLCAPEGNLFCLFEFPVVPPGHRLVVQHVSGFLVVNSNPGVVEADLVGGRGGSSFLVPFSSANAFGAVFASFDQSVLSYHDAGSVPKVFVRVGSGFDGTIEQVVNLAGYLLDCTVSPCAPIAP
jgi:hypothetical protein